MKVSFLASSLVSLVYSNNIDTVDVHHMSSIVTAWIIYHRKITVKFFQQTTVTVAASQS